jgi:hypothetical protein
MCTVTFIPQSDGYLLAMNRDDLYTRDSRLQIARLQFATHTAVHPQEAGGGTWIGTNQFGISFALLNWALRPNGNKEKSRGAVIPRMLTATDLASARFVFDNIEFEGTWPFRLIGILPAEPILNEWRWDGDCISELSHEWGARHWFSSGASDEKAEQIRSAVCAHRWREENAGTRGWVHRLHATHEPEQGPSSICAHRSLGGTLSYTESQVTREDVALAYSPSPPCTGVEFSGAVIMPRLTRAATFAGNISPRIKSHLS